MFNLSEITNLRTYCLAILLWSISFKSCSSSDDMDTSNHVNGSSSDSDFEEESRGRIVALTNGVVGTDPLFNIGTFTPLMSSTVSGWECNCWNATNEFKDELECRCEGQSLLRVPQKLFSTMQRLTIASAGLPLLRSSGLKVYSSSLRDIILSDVKNLETIQDGAFECLKLLRTIYITLAPKLTFLSRNVFQGISDTIKTIRIVNSGLIRVPDLTHLPTNTILHMLDLEGNRIERIEEKSVRVKTEQLILDSNEVETVEDSAFLGSYIGKLSLKGNRPLRIIHPSAFYGIVNIQELDLSRTSIIGMPSIGLSELEVLRVQNTHTLKTIPSIYFFKNLQIALLTHSFHCCAFKFPSRHDPARHAQRLKEIEKWQQKCSSEGSASNQQRQTEINVSHRKRRTYLVDKPDIFYNHFEKQQELGYVTNMSNNEGLTLSVQGSPLLVDGKLIDTVADISDDLGQFHETTDDVTRNNQPDAFCGNWTFKKIDVKCFPLPDALNPCEDVMGYQWLRLSVWIVLALAVIGNVAVLVVILSIRSESIPVPRFLMCHLAFADLCMGLYLLLIASIDAHSMGEYFNYAYDWQYGIGCKAAGFLTVFASHLSVFTLTIITLERWLAITNALYLNKRIKIKPAAYIMVAGWIYSIIMSTFPLYGISNYSSTRDFCVTYSICLPMEAQDLWDIIYLVSILGINGIAFFIIAICYAQIYFSLEHDTRHARNTSPGEMRIARKMALLVFTNFCCWAPIAFFGLTALAGYPLINVTKSKILLVFFYPMNSCADPYLYAILTSQYRHDLYVLLSRFGLCKQKALKYKGSVSLPVTNTSYRISSVHRNSSTSRKPHQNPPTETHVMIMQQTGDFV